MILGQVRKRFGNRLRVTAVAGSLILGFGCGSTTERELRGCPRDDMIWKEAVAEAESDGSLESLRVLALELAETCPDRWEPLWTAGESLFRANRKAPLETYEQMESLWLRALERAELAGDPVGIFRCVNRLATCSKRFGDFDAAQRLSQRALEAAEAVERDDLRGIAYNNLADVHRMRVRLAEAIEALERATFYLERAGRVEDARRLSYNRAVLLGDVGQLSEQRRLLEQLHEEAVAAGDEFLVELLTVAAGNHHLAQNDLETARNRFAEIGSESNQSQNAALGLGRVALREGGWEEAADHLDRAVETGRVPRFLLFSRTFRAEAELRAGNRQAALERTAAVIEDADAAAVADVAAMARTIRGKALMEDPVNIDEAIDTFRQAVEIVEGGSAGLRPTSGGMTYLRERSEPYAELAATLALRDGATGAEELLAVIEHAHSRALRQILSDGAQAPSIVDLATLQSGLEPGEVLFDYLIGEDRGTLLAIGRDDTAVVPLPGWVELRRPLRRYQAAIRRPLLSAAARMAPDDDLRRDIEVGKELRRLLFDAVGRSLRDVRRVYVVPDQDLALLPFAALPTEDSGSSDDNRALRFLGDELEFAVLPMAGSVSGWRGTGVPLLLAGDPLPDPDGEFGALPLAAEELTGVGSVWGEGSHTRLTGDELRTSRLRELRLESFRILHFATHAVASSRDPERCAVILSSGDRLDMKQISGLRLGPALVVLSACQTGGGEMIPGEGVVGLTWAFLRAGARGVVASLWSVEDEATTELMIGFHANLRSGKDAVSALAAAQRSLSAERRHPAYWAPFVAVLGPDS